jgi:short-subunit dehydrogenase
MQSQSKRPVAVVTGASAGVGRATAVLLAQAGYDVGLLARGQAGLDAAAKDIESVGGVGLPVVTDVARWDEVDRAASAVEDELGSIDVWINNAMTTVFARAVDVDPSELRRATEVTYLGQVHGTLAALHRMRPRDHGTIVSVGSALAFVGIPLQSAYCGAKFACRGFHESVRAELLDEGSSVRISMVHLPAVNTPQFSWCLNKMPKRPQPVPPVYEPEVAAAAILAAVRDGRRSKVLGAWNKLIVAGHSVAPSVLSRYAALTGVSSQQTDEPAEPDQPANLERPVDTDADHGARGSFDGQARGVLDPSFLRSLPKTAVTAGRAAAGAAGDKLASPFRR